MKRIEDIDTGKGSLLHYLWGVRPSQQRGVFQIAVLPYLVTVFMVFVIPLIIAWITMGPHTYQPYQFCTDQGIREVAVPYLRDWNMNFSLLIVLPTLVIFLLSESNLIHQSIHKLRKEHILFWDKITENELYVEWQFKYRISNYIAYTLGIMAGILAFWINYRIRYMEGSRAWQNTPDSNLSSWIFWVFQVPIVWAVLVTWVVRYYVHIRFLFGIVEHKKCIISVKFFHPDRCGGLHPISRIGIRVQYVIAIIGTNILAMVYILSITSPLKNGSPIVSVREIPWDLAIMAILSFLLYLVLTPLAFLGPLLPFRNSMQEKKDEVLHELSDHYESEFQLIKKNIGSGEPAEKDNERITRMEKIWSLANQFPVWPFDTATLTKFLLAMGMPALGAIGTGLVAIILKWGFGSAGCLGR